MTSIQTLRLEGPPCQRGKFFQRYFFIMPTLARFELETHQRVEKGGPLTADAMIELMADLFSEGYGGEMNLNRPRVGITWETFTTAVLEEYVDRLGVLTGK